MQQQGLENEHSLLYTSRGTAFNRYQKISMLGLGAFGHSFLGVDTWDNPSPSPSRSRTPSPPRSPSPSPLPPTTSAAAAPAAVLGTTHNIAPTQNDRRKLVVLKRHGQTTSNNPDPENGFHYSRHREISILQELQGHPNIIELIDVLPVMDKVWLVLELMASDLRTLLRDGQPTAWSSSRQLPPMRDCRGGFYGRRLKLMMKQILSAVAHCHSRRIAHRNLKPQKFFISKDGQRIVLSGFRLARCIHFLPNSYGSLAARAGGGAARDDHDDDGNNRYRDQNKVRSALFANNNLNLSPQIATLWYRAPEIFLGLTHYSPFAVDVWSVGCIFAELASGETLFKGDCEISQLLAIFQILGTPTEQEWPGISQLPNFNCGFPVFFSTTMTQQPDRRQAQSSSSAPAATTVMDAAVKEDDGSSRANGGRDDDGEAEAGDDNDDHNFQNGVPLSPDAAAAADASSQQQERQAREQNQQQRAQQVEYHHHRKSVLRSKFPPKLMSVLGDDGFDLLLKLVTYDPDKRITARDALRHPWFDDVA